MKANRSVISLGTAVALGCSAFGSFGASGPETPGWAPTVKSGYASANSSEERLENYGESEDPSEMGAAWGWSNRVAVAGTDYCVLAFTNTAASGFTWTVPAGVTSFRYLVVGGGGSGASGGKASTSTAGGGGGGAGGLREGELTSVEAGCSYVIRVGAGGIAPTVAATDGGDGVDSSISQGEVTVVCARGGGGGGAGVYIDGVTCFEGRKGHDGGCGGGGGGCNTNGVVLVKVPAGGSSLDAEAGFAGGSGSFRAVSNNQSAAGGGGGAGAVGGNAAYNSPGAGGDGKVSDITGTEVRYAGGGGGAYGKSGTRAGGTGGGGTGGSTPTAGADGLGAGGGGARSVGAGKGGDGIVIVRYAVSGGAEPEPPTHVHAWGEGSVTAEATCVKTGVRTFRCSLCAETKTEEIAIDPDNHLWATVPYKTEDGYAYYRCVRTGCAGEKRTEVEEPDEPLDYAYGEPDGETAVTYTWTGGAVGAWANPANWQPDRTPCYGIPSNKVAKAAFAADVAVDLTHGAYPLAAVTIANSATVEVKDGTVGLSSVQFSYSGVGSTLRVRDAKLIANRIGVGEATCFECVGASTLVGAQNYGFRPWGSAGHVLYVHDGETAISEMHGYTKSSNRGLVKVENAVLSVSDYACELTSGYDLSLDAVSRLAVVRSSLAYAFGTTTLTLPAKGWTNPPVFAARAVTVSSGIAFAVDATACTTPGTYPLVVSDTAVVLPEGGLSALALNAVCAENLTASLVADKKTLYLLISDGGSAPVVAENGWLVEPSLAKTVWNEDEEPSAVGSGTPTYGRVVVTYDYGVTEMPVAPGEHVAHFVVEPSTGWTGLVKDISFTVAETAPQPGEVSVPAGFDAAHTIVCYGDSITEGYSSTNVMLGVCSNYHDGRYDGTKVNYSYPYELSRLVPSSYNVVNQSHGGMETDAILAWQGGVMVRSTADITLNANGTSYTSCPTNLLFDGRSVGTADSDRCKGMQSPTLSAFGGTGATISGWMNGVHVVFSGGTSWSNAKLRLYGSTESNVTIPAGSRFIPDNAIAYGDAVQVFFVGQNDKAANYRRYLPLIRQTVAKIPSQRYVVVSTHSSRSEEMESAFAEAFGEHYLNLYREMDTRGLETALALGIMMQEEYDSRESFAETWGHPMWYWYLTEFATYKEGEKYGYPGIHFNAKGYRVTGQFVYEKLRALGYLDAPSEENAWETEPSISKTSWSEGESAGTLDFGEAKFGAVTCNYTQEQVNAFERGSHKVTFTVAAKAGAYTGLTKSIDVTVTEKKASLSAAEWTAYMQGIDTDEKLAAVKARVAGKPTVKIAFANSSTDRTHGTPHDDFEQNEMRKQAAYFGLDIEIVRIQPVDLASGRTLGVVYQEAVDRADIVCDFSSYWDDSRDLAANVIAANPDKLFILPYGEISPLPPTGTSLQGLAQHRDGTGYENMILTSPIGPTTGGGLTAVSRRTEGDTETITFVIPSGWAAGLGDTCRSASMAGVLAAWIWAAHGDSPTAAEIVRLMAAGCALPGVSELAGFTAESLATLTGNLSKYSAEDDLGRSKLIYGKPVNMANVLALLQTPVAPDPVVPGVSSKAYATEEAALTVRPTEVTVPAGVSAALAAKPEALEAYARCFKIVTRKISDGQWVNEAVLTEAARAVLQKQVDGGVAKVLPSLAEGTLKLSSVTPGFYYAVMFGETLQSMERQPAELAIDAGGLTLTIPQGRTSGFYRVIASERQ